MATERLTAAQFKALVNAGALIPTRRGLITSNEDIDDKIAQIRQMPEKKIQSQKQIEANKRYLAKKKTGRKSEKKKSVYISGFIDSNLIKKAVKKWNKQNAIFIPYDVSSLKNSKQIVPYLDQDGHAKFSLIPSKASQKYKRYASPYWISARDMFGEMIQGMRFPIAIGFFFIRKRAGIFDYHNMEQYPLDLMRDFGWIPDDSNLYVSAFSMGHVIDNLCPGVVVKAFDVKVLPFFDHPYEKIGYPDAFFPIPSGETVAMWEAIKNWKEVDSIEFYETEDEVEPDETDNDSEEDSSM